mmetsp:Transcript_16962/g.46585  ORF Transcript_16962/g.46585 Transcript_16962/m.46585 type:complete len:212 (-) Transcript_16962:88-723(-)
MSQQMSQQGRQGVCIHFFSSTNPIQFVRCFHSLISCSYRNKCPENFIRRVERQHADCAHLLFLNYSNASCKALPLFAFGSRRNKYPCKLHQKSSGTTSRLRPLVVTHLIRSSLMGPATLCFLVLRRNEWKGHENCIGRLVFCFRAKVCCNGCSKQNIIIILANCIGQTKGRRAANTHCNLQGLQILYHHGIHYTSNKRRRFHASIQHDGLC